MINAGTSALPMSSAPAALTQDGPSVNISPPSIDGEYHILPVPILRGPTPRDVTLEDATVELEPREYNRTLGAELLCNYIHSLGREDCILRMLPTEEYPEGRVLNDDLIDMKKRHLVPAFANLHDGPSPIFDLPGHNDNHERDTNRNVFPGAEMRATALDILDPADGEDPNDNDQDEDDMNEPLLPRA